MLASNLLTAFMLGGWIAVTPAAIAAPGSTPSLHSGSAHSGDLRTAKSVTPRNRRGQPRVQTRYDGKSYANLNQ